MGTYLVASLCALAAIPSAENLVRNPSFEGGTDRHGAPAEWRASGDSRYLTQTLTLDRGRDGRACAKLSCTRFEHRNAACHAMICQMGSAGALGQIVPRGLLGPS